jgi:signal transduction histidine kinase
MLATIAQKIEPYAPGQAQRIFLFLVGYRWASLIPTLWLVLHPSENEAAFHLGWVLVVAGVNTMLITLFHRPLNQRLLKQPFLLGIDLFFSAGLLAVSGGSSSPFYLYALSPLLAGAFFFQFKGALVVTTAFTPLFWLALRFSNQFGPSVPVSPSQLFSQIAGIWLMPFLVAYPSALLERLRAASRELTGTRDHLAQQNMELENANHQLKIIHGMTLLLQAAPDIWTVQQRVLDAVVGELGFSQAVVGLVDPVNEDLGDWRSSQNEHHSQEAPPQLISLPLTPESGPLVQALLNQEECIYKAGDPITRDERLNAWLGGNSWLCLPFTLRERPVGVLLVEVDDLQPSLSHHQQVMLDVVVSQAAVALGTTMVCIDRTRRLAVEQERNRIAREIHDTVAQSLFGIVYTLDACTDMLPEKAVEVRSELLDLRDLASDVRDQVRRSIYDLWPSELNLERFQADLNGYVSQCARAQPFELNFTTCGDFSRLSPAIKRTLYRVAQEALSNTVHHSGASSATVCLAVDSSQVHMKVRDHGCGFDPQVVLSRQRDRERFGLHGIRERVRELGGESEIWSEPEQGAFILVSLPVHRG